jgi:hypothetical protein
MRRIARIKSRFGLVQLTLLAFTALAGCGSHSRYGTATIAGRVTVDGKPVPKGAISFSPMHGTAGTVVGAAIKAGQYRCEQVPIGNVTVTFVAQDTEPIEFVEKGTGIVRHVPRDILPPGYASGLTAEIAGDRSEMNFDLKSKEP